MAEQSSPAMAAFVLAAIMIFCAWKFSPGITTEQRSWPRVAGRVIEVWYEYNGGKHKDPEPGRSFGGKTPHARVLYSVNGKQYTIERAIYAGPGDLVGVRYEPAHPAIAVNEPTKGEASWPVFVYCLAGILFAYGVFVKLCQASGFTPAWLTYNPPTKTDNRFRS